MTKIPLKKSRNHFFFFNQSDQLQPRRLFTYMVYKCGCAFFPYTQNSPYFLCFPPAFEIKYNNHFFKSLY